MHTHIFPDKIAAAAVEKLSHISRTRPFTDGTLNGLYQSMDEARINLSVILPVATNTGQVEKINVSAAALTEGFADDGIISFGTIHPDSAGYREELSRVKNFGLKGIKIHPVYQDTDIDDAKFLRILDRAAELDLIVVAHAGADIGFPGVVRCSPQMIRRAVDIVGNLKLVAAHMGGWKNWSDVPKFLADTEIFIDTAFATGSIIPRNDCHWQADDLKLLTAAQFMKLVDIFGADRILFGTDSPWTAQDTSLEWIRALPLDDAARNKILGLNAKALLDI